jgi:hypothetical protein
MRRLRGPQLCIALAGLVLVAPAAVFGQDVRVSAGTIEDRRTTGRFFAGLEVELKLTGDDLADAKSARVLLKKAVDETGRDLLPEKKSDEDFRSFQGSDLKLSLKNPARNSSAIREISGQLELYVPTRDPASTVTIDRVTSKMDRSVESPALKAQKISLRVVSPKAHRAAAKKREAEFDKEMEKHKEEMKKEAGDDKSAEALMALMKGFSGMMNEVGDNDLIVEFEDEQKKILDMSVVDSKGDSISSNGSMSSGGLKIIQFGQKLPPDAKLKVLLQTKKSIVAAPFSLTNVPLP